MIGTTFYSDGLIVLKCDDELGKYLRRLFLLTFGIRLQAPSRGSHVLVSFPEENVKQNLESVYLNFDLDLSQVFTNQNAMWINVISSDIIKYRNFLLLGKNPRDIHFCIGYLYNYETKRPAD